MGHHRLELLGGFAVALVACSLAAGSTLPRARERTAPDAPSAPSATIAERAELQTAPASEPGAHAAAKEPPPPPEVDDRPRPQKQWDHIQNAAPPTCREQLADAGAKFQPLADVAAPNREGCGIPHGVLLTRGPTGLRYSPPLSIDCSFALRLIDVERIIQEEAERHMGGPVLTVRTLGSYACRDVVGRLKGWTGGISEHSFGNAVDLSRFEPAKGRAASVLGAYQPDLDEPTTPQGRFLRTVQRRVRREVGLRALGPDFDASHRDHLHLDAGSPWWR